MGEKGKVEETEGGNAIEKEKRKWKKDYMRVRGDLEEGQMAVKGKNEWIKCKR